MPADVFEELEALAQSLINSSYRVIGDELNLALTCARARLAERDAGVYLMGWNDGVKRAHHAASEGLEQNWHPQEILNNVEDQFRPAPRSPAKEGEG